ATEVDDAVLALVATADVASGDAALVVAAARLGERAKQRLLGRGAGDLDEISNARTATTRGRRLVLANSHSVFLLALLQRSREDIDGTRLQRDDGALGVLALAHAKLRATGL